MAKTRNIKGNKFLYYIEKSGNSLPNPALLFGIFGLLTLIISAIGYYLGWAGKHPANGEIITVVNLLSVDGLHRIILEMVNNYTGFAPLGIVMVAMLGIGVAESSGLIKSAINVLLTKAPKNWVTFIIIFSGI
mgnify:CR=1 FL=1|jgi:aminobenzoyl-glutamate transport protein